MAIAFPRGREAKRVRRRHVGVLLAKRARIHKLLDPFTRPETRVVLALVADLQVVLELTRVQQLTAALVFTAHPQAIRGSICAWRRARLARHGNVARLLTK